VTWLKPRFAGPVTEIPSVKRTMARA
jgi:hypothetical protein